MTVDEKLDLILSRLDKMDDKFDKMDDRFDKMENRLDKVESELADVKVELADVKVEQEEIKKAQVSFTIQLENIVDKSLQVLLEGYKMNAETFARFDVNKIRQNTDYAVSIATIAYNEVMKQKAS